MIRPVRIWDVRGVSLFLSRRQPRRQPNRLFSTEQQSVFQSTYSANTEFRSSKKAFQPLLKQEVRQFSSTVKETKKKGRRKYVPRKAAVKMTEQARTFFLKLLKNNPSSAGIMLNYEQATNGQPRMVFSFDFVAADKLSPTDEGVSFEVNEDGTPKSPEETLGDGKPKLYVNGNAFLKVLGATVDINLETITAVLIDREGNQMDPNA